MADDKKDEGVGIIVDRDKFVFGLLALLFALLVTGSLFETNKFFNYFYDSTNRGENSEEVSTGFLYPDEINLGDTVINKKIAKVRQSPGGQLVGTQAKRIKGRIIEGPVRKFDLDWWRIDYPNAPDGWVEVGSFTNKVLAFSLFNFFPIAFEFLRPIFVILSVIIVVLILLVFLKMSDLNKLLKKKDEVESEQKVLKSGHVSSSIISEDKNDDIVDDLPVPGLPIGEKPKTEDVHNKRWATIQGLIRSYNSSDWKQAIIEADAILDEMLDKMNYKGESMGEKLKKIEPSDFITLNQAWEAHKFRNRIAHGDKYVLSKDEAERIIGLYEEVFNEFFYI